MPPETRTLSESVYRAVVEFSPIAKILIDRVGTMVLVNAQAEKLFGYAREALLGQPIDMLVPLRVRGHHPRLREGFFADPRTRQMGAGRDLAGLRSDGSEFPVEIGLSPISTSEGEFVLASVLDITDRKRAEERFRMVVEFAPTAMIMINREGRIVLVNSQTQGLFGYTREELMNLKIEALVPQHVHTGHPKLREGFFAEPRPRSMGVGRELHGVRKDGSEVPVEIGLSPISTPEGDFVLASVVDITERKRAEQQVKSAAELAAQRAKELERLAELENFRKLTIGRELKMIELKKEIERLKRAAGETP